MRKFLFVFLVLVFPFLQANTMLDLEAPQITINVPSEVPADLPFDLSLASNEPVTYTIRYAGLELSQVAQSYVVSLLAAEGSQTIEINAKDGSNNEVSFQHSLYGIPTLKPELRVPESVQSGSPASIFVTWPETGLQPTTLGIYVDGEVQRFYKTDREVVSLLALPLGSSPSIKNIQVVLADEYGRTVTLNDSLAVVKDTQEVEDLNLSADTFSVVTAEGRDREAEALNQAYATAEMRPEPLWRSPFIMPIEGRFSSGYGSPRRYVTGGNVSYHNGLDIAAPQGTPIVATNDGLVVISNYYPIKGGLVVIDHGYDVFSFYFHQSKMLVEVGEVVSQGQVIGEVGSTGLSTGPHLHWEMRIEGVATNPLSWVGKQYP